MGKKSELDLGNPAKSSGITRRRMLQAGVALGSVPVLSSLASQASAAPEPLEVPVWTKSQGSVVGSQLYGSPVTHAQHIHRILPAPPAFDRTYVPVEPNSSWSYTPLQDLDGMVTPNGLFYERHHAGIPDIDPAQHRLVLHGMVERDLMFTVEDIRRFPSVSVFYFVECSGNTDTEWTGAGGITVQQTHGLLSCAQWTGVRVSTLLREAGYRSDAKWLIAEGADASAMSRSVPLARALDDCLVVYAQNGEPLRGEQGYPLRLLVPGCEGNINIKWLRRLEVTDQAVNSREETSKYSDPIYPDRAPDPVLGRSARQFTLTMETKSVITSPSGGMELPERGFYEIRGLAWSGYGSIARVDVSVDGGRNWQPAALDAPVLPKCLTSFRLPWRWDGKSSLLLSRAIDQTGYVQPTRGQLLTARGGELTEYHNNGIQGWHLDTNGKVMNISTSGTEVRS